MANIWGEVGTAAGKVYTSYGGVSRPVAVDEIKRKTRLDDAMLNMAIGWLLREDKVIVDKTGAQVTVKLK